MIKRMKKKKAKRKSKMPSHLVSHAGHEFVSLPLHHSLSWTDRSTDFLPQHELTKANRRDAIVSKNLSSS